MENNDTILNITLKKAGPPVLGEVPVLPPFTEHLGDFKGDEGNPFLAPRGVFLAKGSLFVADTGQNRVFIWKKVPIGTTFCTPDLVLGQEENADTGRNGGKAVSARSLQYPSGIWSDGQCLIVADAWNHRVLIWRTMPTENGQAADVVLGQPDFEHNQPNVKGIGANPTAQSLNWPYGVFSDGVRLWIADTGNRRVLFFKAIPTESYTPADGVIGKDSFEERDYDPADAIWPYSVKIGPEGQLAIADTQYFRVLVWKHWENAFAEKARVLIGQTDFESNGANQYGLYPQKNTLNWCYDACFFKNGLLVADTGNSRILWFDPIPESNNAPAQNLIGKPDFTMGSENAATVFGTDQMLYWPFSISTEGNLIVLADTGNHRIVVVMSVLVMSDE